LDKWLLIATMVLSCSAMEAAAAAAEQAMTGSTDGNQFLVCRKEKVTGTRIPETVCRYQSEMKDDRENARRYLRDSARINARGSSKRSGTIKH